MTNDAYGVYANVYQAGLATSNVSLQRIAAFVVDAPTGPTDPYLITGGYEEYKKVYGYSTIGAKSRVPLKNLLNSTSCWCVRSIGAGSKKAVAYITKGSKSVYANTSTIGIGDSATMGLFKTITATGGIGTQESFTAKIGDMQSDPIPNTSTNKDSVLANIAIAINNMFISNGYDDGEAFVLDNNPSKLLSYGSLSISLPNYNDIPVNAKLSFTVVDNLGKTAVTVAETTKAAETTASNFISAITANMQVTEGNTTNISETNGIITILVKKAAPGEYSYSFNIGETNTITPTLTSVEGRGMIENTEIVVRLPSVMDNDTPISIVDQEDAPTNFEVSDTNILATAISTGVLPNDYTITLTINSIDQGSPVINLIDCKSVTNFTGTAIVSIIDDSGNNNFTGDVTDYKSLIKLLADNLPSGTSVEDYGNSVIKVTMPAGNEISITKVSISNDTGSTDISVTASEYVAPTGAINVNQGYIQGKTTTSVSTGINIALTDVIDDSTGKNIFVNDVLGSYSQASLTMNINNTNQLEWAPLIGKTIKLGGGKYVEPADSDILQSWNVFYDTGKIPVIRLMPTVNKSNKVAVHKLIVDILKQRGIGVGVLNKPDGYTDRASLMEYRTAELGINSYRGRIEGTNVKLTDDLTGVSSFYSSAGEVAYKIVAAGYQAAAGIDGNRGILDSVIDVDVHYSKEDRDFLDPAGINLILNKGSLGNVIYGESTLQTSYLPLRDTHNVMIVDDIILQGKDTLEYSMFNFNSVNQRTLAQKRLEAIVDPLYKADVISEYKVDLDITKEDPVDVAKGKMVAKLFIRMYASIKWIELNVYALDSSISIELAESTAS